MPAAHSSPAKGNILLYGAIGLLMAACTGWLGFGVAQSDFWRIMLGVVPFFLLYAGVLVYFQDKVPLSWWIGLGLLLRVIMWWSFPLLSDDVYRFVWDGRLMLNGINPYANLPAWYLEPAHEMPGLDAELFGQLNSPQYFTVYPPLAQGTFALSTWLFPQSLAGSVWVMKAILLAAEVGSLVVMRKILAKWELDPGRVLIYWLNPLIIVEIMGNLHYEGLMIFFLLLAVWWLLRAQPARAAVAMALATATKLMPLLFLPLLIRRLKGKGRVYFFGLFVLAGLLLFLVLASGPLWQNFRESLDLYFRKFEFNASVYYLVRWLGYQQFGYNMIARVGPVLAAFTALFVFGYAVVEKRPQWNSLPGAMLFASCIFLFLATTIHPWYLATPLALCLFTPYRFPVLWSGLVFLTYVNYSYDPWRENLWWVGVEYLLVGGFAIREVYRELPEWPSRT